MVIVVMNWLFRAIVGSVIVNIVGNGWVMALVDYSWLVASCNG